jgi:hypothetical protein
MSYKTFNIDIDYKKKKILYNMNCYGNHTASKIRNELKTLDEIDSRFEKMIYISENFLEHYFTSPTYHEEISKIFNERVFGKYPVFCTKEHRARKGVDLTPVTRELISHLVEVKKEKQKIERFYRDLRRLDYIPHVKLKHFDIKKLDKRVMSLGDCLSMLKNGQKLEDIVTYFNPNTYPQALENYKSSIISNDILEQLEAVGFKFSKESKRYQELKITKVFSALGDNHEETA